MPPASVRDGLASQTSTAHTLLYWHYRITRMDVLIGHVCVVEQTTEWSNVCSKEISYCFKFIIIHKSLYTKAVYVD